MRELIVMKNDSDQRLDKFLTKTLKTLPKPLMYKYIRKKKIKVNHKRCEIAQRLTEGDSVQLYINEEFFDNPQDYSFLKSKGKLNIVYEDEDILIMNKEIGLLTHSDDVSQCDTLVDRMLKYLYEKKEFNPANEQSFKPALCHRIDRNTQGLVIAAKNAKSLRFINQMIKDKKIEKKYLCLVSGKMNKKKDTLIHYHLKEEKENKAILSDAFKEGYKKISCSYKVISDKKDISLLEVDLHSGKSHQIRAQLAKTGHPLLSDVKYGGKKTVLPYHALCAYKLVFPVCETCGFSGKTIELKEIELLKYYNNI